MNDRGLRLSLLVGAAIATASGCRPALSEPAPLGAPPLCEASSIIRLHDGSERWLVADNENDEGLFVFLEREGSLVPAPEAWLALPGLPADIEAMAVSEGELVVVGSHSRGKRCKAGGNRDRQVVTRYNWTRDGASLQTALFGHSAIAQLERPDATVDDCLRVLFTNPELQWANEVCIALMAASRGARPGACESVNIEAAASVADAKNEARLWLGLRTPLVEGHAVLLRSAPITGPTGDLRIDGVALLDLGGAGLRGLDGSGDLLLGIAGPTKTTPKSAFFSAPHPVPGARSSVRHLRDLPSDAEGLARDDQSVFFVLDGGAPDEKNGACKTPARQMKAPGLP